MNSNFSEFGLIEGQFVYFLFQFSFAKLFAFGGHKECAEFENQ